MGCYSTESELARHDSRAHVQQLTIFSTTPACFARYATRDVNITYETFIEIDSLQHLEISRQTYPTNRSKIRATTFTVLTLC